MITTDFFPLSSAKLGREYSVFKIKNSKKLRRLLDLGITNGAKITPLNRSPIGNLTAYKIRGTVIALRNEDAENIIVYGS